MKTNISAPRLRICEWKRSKCVRFLQKIMCGRTCLTLEPNQIRCACKYKTSKRSLQPKNEASKDPQRDDKQQEDTFITPEWRSEFNCGRKYVPSFNVAPTDITPVLVSSQHFADAANLEEKTRVLVPMMWGMIPFWHKGDYRKHGLTTNNCRLEHMLESKLYRGPFRRGQRCVILCEGFYEWQTTKSAKPSERAAHLLYMPQAEEVKIYDKTTWSPDNINLLKMAGLFDVWEDENGDKMFSYSVITFESSKIMSWLHHRMPAILETEQQVNDWLDFKRVSDKDALATLRPAIALKWYRVSNVVNNSRNKSDECNKPIELVKSKTPATPMNKTMLAWLNVRKRREEDIAKHEKDSDDDSDEANATAEQTSAVENPPKRPCYREFLKSKTSSSDSASEKDASVLKTLEGKP